VVARYYGTRVLATGFAVADAAVTGATAEALALVRHALETGTDPVPLVAALASKLRTLAKVGAARGRAGASELGLAPWQVERAQRDLRHWTADALAQAIEAVAAADHEGKGAPRSPALAGERAAGRRAELAAGGGRQNRLARGWTSGGRGSSATCSVTAGWNAWPWKRVTPMSVQRPSWARVSIRSATSTAPW